MRNHLAPRAASRPASRTESGRRVVRAAHNREVHSRKSAGAGSHRPLRRAGAIDQQIGVMHDAAISRADFHCAHVYRA
jgi:hypothetical protein